MAIVINGNGTVTGISVGGLPDGVVDAGTLATNSVDSAELIDGAVDDSHMAAMAASKLTGTLPAISGASLTGFTASQMPTGSVVQYGFVVNGDYLQLSDTSWVSSGITTEFTPLLSSSKLIVWGIVISSMWNISNRGTSVKMKLKVEDTYLREAQTQSGAQHAGQTHAMTAAQTQMGIYTNSDTTAKTVEIWVQNEDGDYCNASINQYSGQSQLLIMEVAV